jgi:predicted RNase H-like HicB family nuclease
MQIGIHCKLHATVCRDDDAKLFVTSVPSLHLHAFGVTDEEARGALKDAAKLYLTEHWKRGSLEKRLKEEGFSPVNGPFSVQSNDFISVHESEDAKTITHFEFDVPLTLDQQAGSASKAAA